MGAAVAVVGGERETGRSGITGIGPEDHRSAVRRQHRDTVAGVGDAVEDGIPIGVASDKIKVKHCTQIRVRENVGQHRRELGPAVEHEAVIGIQHLAVSAVGDAVTGDIRHRARDAEDRAVGAIDAAIGVQVARHGHRQSVGAAADATKFELVQPFGADAKQRHRPPAAGQHRQRRQAGDRWQRVANHLDAQQQLPAGGAGDLATADAEGVERGLAGRAVAAAVLALELACAAEIGSDRALDHAAVSAVLDDHAGLPDRHHGGQAAILVSVAIALASAQVAHHRQLPGAVVLVNQGRAVRRRHPHDAALAVADELQRRAGFGRDAVVADEQPPAVGANDFLHTLVGVESVQGAVGRAEFVVEAAEATALRVVGHAAGNIEEPRTVARQQCVDRFQDPAIGNIGLPCRPIECQRADHFDRRAEGEGGAIPVGHRQPEPGRVGKRVEDADRFASGRRQVGFDAHIAAREAPAPAERRLI